jgi:hypothetical protein
VAKLRVRLEINRGRTGAPLSKLARIAEQTEKFLRALAADSGVPTKPNEWLAVNFKNGSVSFDSEFQGEIAVAAAEIYARNLEFVADFDADVEGANGSVSDSTLAEYARLGTLIDPDEVIGLGIYRPASRKPRWRQISYSKTAEIRQRIETPLPGYGAVQGILHAWFKEVRDPHFQLRELSTNNLVACFYTADHYDDVARAVRERTTILHVSGSMMFDRVRRVATELRADRIDRAEMLDPKEFEALFGSDPAFTGTASTAEFMDEMRQDG